MLCSGFNRNAYSLEFFFFLSFVVVKMRIWYETSTGASLLVIPRHMVLLSGTALIW